MAFTLAVISDVHDAGAGAGHAGEYGRILLTRAVRRLNRHVRPDAVAVLGDLLDDAAAPDAMERLAALKQVLDLFEAPVIVIPGNHDPEPDLFYQVFEKPPEHLDVGGVRLVPFVDPPEPGHNARRMPQDLERMRAARRGHTGPIVCLQHVPVLPPGETPSPYNYTNADEVIAAMEEAGITLAVGGHYHAGTELVRKGGSAFLAVKALFQAPFTYTLIRVDGDRLELEEQRLQMPPELGLVDLHSHSEFAYCAKGVRLSLSPKLAELFGLAAMAFTEHSAQLYYEQGAYRKGVFYEAGVEATEGYASRMEEFWRAAEGVRSERVLVGLEIDADFRGRLVARPEDLVCCDVKNGAVHQLPELRKKAGADPQRAADEFLGIMEELVRTGIDIVVHPFRVFRRGKVPVPTWTYDRVVRMLKESGVAAEVNFHTNEPDPEFFRRCVEAGVKLTFGSDAHEPYEVGEFYPHLELLKEIGYDGELRDILWVPGKVKAALG